MHLWECISSGRVPVDHDFSSFRFARGKVL